MKFQLTFVVTYEVDPENYEEDKSPTEMVDEDVADAEELPERFFANAHPYQCKVTGKVIEE